MYTRNNSWMLEQQDQSSSGGSQKNGEKTPAWDERPGTTRTTSSFRVFTQQKLVVDNVFFGKPGFQIQKWETRRGAEQDEGWRQWLEQVTSKRSGSVVIFLCPFFLLSLAGADWGLDGEGVREDTYAEGVPWARINNIL